jgi:DnaJ-class molecular chaperone
MQSTVDKLLALCSKAAPVNHYKVLGVTPTANEQEIRAAFKSAALKFHPDKAPDGMWRAAAEVVFRLVSEASRVLSDANNRAEYDKVVAAESQRRGSPSTSK